MIAFVIGCSKEEEELPKLELNATELTFKSDGGDELVGVTSNTNWSVVSSEKWCEVSPSSSKGDGAIKVSAQKNEKAENRTAKISVVSGSLTRIVMVSQAGAGGENGSDGNNEENGDGSNNDGGNTPNPIVTYQLTLTSSPTAGGTVTGGGSYESGKSVTISASANLGYTFVKWSDGNTSASRTITVSGNRSLTAYFELKPVQQYSITLSKSPSAGGSVYGGGTYEEGKIVTITATPASGYEFTKWSDGVTSNPRTVTVTKDMSLTANFEKKLEPMEPLDKSLGKLNGKFSVSAIKQVSFAMGNLQYQASTDTWRFAENQYDVIGKDNEKISSTYSGWIDLFGWGTSGYNGKDPYMTSRSYGDYGDGYNDIAGTNYDWGVYNAISNGGNKAGMWRTLTDDEWYYLFNTRGNAENLRGQATVNGQTGYILLPDGWSTPSGLRFTAKPYNFTTNSYSAPDWSKMETAGAVFLPCAGYRYVMDVNYVGSTGFYWSSTAYSSNYAYDFYFFGSFDALDDDYRSDGNSVRLATE